MKLYVKIWILIYGIASIVFSILHTITNSTQYLGWSIVFAIGSLFYLFFGNKLLRFLYNG